MNVNFFNINTIKSQQIVNVEVMYSFFSLFFDVLYSQNVFD